MKFSSWIFVYICIVILVLEQDVTGVQVSISSGIVGGAGGSGNTNPQSGVVGTSSVSSGTTTPAIPSTGSSDSSASSENSGPSNLTPKEIQGTGIIGGNVGSQTSTSSSASTGSSGTTAGTSSMVPKVIHETGTVGSNVGSETNTSSSASTGNNGTTTGTSSMVPKVIHETGTVGSNVGSETNTSSSASSGSSGTTAGKSNMVPIVIQGFVTIGGKVGSGTTNSSSGVNTVVDSGTIGNDGSNGSNVKNTPKTPVLVLSVLPKIGSKSNTTANNGSTKHSILQKVNCGMPDTMRDSYYYLSGTSVYDTVDYFCFSGVVLSGYLTRTCQLNGTWSGFGPVCTERTSKKGKTECRQPGLKRGSSYIQARRPYYVGHNMHYKCDYGHTYVSGDLNRTCQADKTWSGTPMLCKIVYCPLPALVPNAKRFAHGQNFHNTIRYNCTPPFVFESGSLTRTCQANNEWSGVPPVCAKLGCGNPEVKEGSHYVKNRHNYRVGHVMHYSCDNGYAYVSGNLDRTCQYNNTWSGTPPLCKKVNCPLPGIVPNAHRKVHGQHLNSTIQYNCTPPYVFESGSLTRTCQANNEWSGVTPVCGLPIRPWPPSLLEVCKERFEMERQKLLQKPGGIRVFTFNSFIQRIRSMNIQFDDKYIRACLDYVLDESFNST